MVLHTEAEDKHASLEFYHFVELTGAHCDFKHFLEGDLGHAPKIAQVFSGEKFG